MTDLSMRKEKKKKKSSWLLIASPSLLSIKQDKHSNKDTSTQIRKISRLCSHLPDEAKDRESDRCANPPVGMLPSHAPVQQEVRRQKDPFPFPAFTA